MEIKFCQSCGMPLTNEILGTNADGSTNEDYCVYCYKDGKFAQDMTMEQMIDHCAQFTDEINKQSGQNLTKEQAKEMSDRVFASGSYGEALCIIGEYVNITDSEPEHKNSLRQQLKATKPADPVKKQQTSKQQER